jgi:uncharacterized cupin superfamily protein
MPKVDLNLILPKLGSDYPRPFDEPLSGRQARRISQATEITDFNVNHVIVPPGSWSSQRHWHEAEDELVVVLSGTGVLIDDEGRHPISAGDVAVFPKGVANGHHIVNEGQEALVLVAVSHEERSTVHYSDIDLIWTPEGGELHPDGTSYVLEQKVRL